MPIVKRLTAVALAGLLAACNTTSATAPPPPAPAADLPTTEGTAAHAMVAAANPMAVEAGLKVLREGGSAVDAAVAVQAVLGLVEPQSSGLGGGAFMTYYDARTKTVTAYDGRETAPKAATPELFLGADGKPMNRIEAILSGRSTGVPGAVAMLAMAQADHGRLPWNRLFAEAERLADQGFVVPRRMGEAANGRSAQARTADAAAYFTKPDGTRIKPGDTFRNPAYAETVRKIAAEGPKALLEGSIAEAIVAKVREGDKPGAMTLADMRAYRPRKGAALCRPFRVYVVCTPNAPSGGPAVLEGLGLLERTDIAAHGPDTVQGWYLFSQASRLMYADRDRYMGDPAFVDVPVEGLLDPAYLDARAKLINPDQAGPAPPPGNPRGAGVRAPDATKEVAGTTHFAVVDAEGNAVSMTTTVESIFGSGRMVGGFFLNNQLTDFSFAPANTDGAPAANAVAGGKRPRSSMAPAVVLDRQGRFVAAVGSPGGPAILAYNLKALTATLDWKLPMQDALALPNLIASGTFYAAEVDKFAPGVRDGLAAKGVQLRSGAGAEGSGLHGIERLPDGSLRGGADPRREGVALGY
ncbi:gamma-glutamyltransferase [Phenylobacterium sp. J367]|uniref:gamma-glutamyltransferase n=1 Tax=Phenylobacterium sp. J367 TaxID=2898435 RepID=UPI002150C712|nr:gamma-glutamyltransferase [Phenylobacterium sp. J367]MCR5877563.1 gamma-glutamyltransferase [Phenylobacterium sp. J367]